MHKVDCPKFIDGCESPLCPLDRNSMKDGIWYSNEGICRRKDFQNLDWIKRQKQIAKAKALKDKYFTVPMLQAIKQVRKGIEGVNPDQLLDEARKAEQRWIEGKNSGRVIAKKRDSLAFVANTSHRGEEVKNEL